MEENVPNLACEKVKHCLDSFSEDRSYKINQDIGLG